MPSIVLDSFSRASIRFEKLATKESDRLADLQISGEIDIKEARSVPFKAGADRLNNKISENKFEISKADKYLGSLENSLNAINQMQDIVDRIKDLEEAASAEENVALSTSYTAQADELKEQMITMGENASFRGMNLFSSWGQETFQIGGQSFSAQSVNLDDVISGFAYRGGNVLGIENGDFDTSAYSNLVAAYGPDTINNSYKDFTGNYQDAMLQGAATIDATGPGNIYGVHLPDNASRADDGSHAEIEEITFPDSFSIGVWFKFDNVTQNDRILAMTNGGLDGLLHFNAMASNNMRVLYQGTDGSIQRLDTPAGTVQNDEWAYWMMTLETDGTVEIFKNGNSLAQSTLGAGPKTGLRSEVYLGAARSTTQNSTEGAVADFAVFDGALSQADAEKWYNDVAQTGLEESFFTMNSEKMQDAFEKMEAHYETLKVGIEAQRDQMVFKNELYADEVTNLMGVDSEEVAIQSNLAQMRQTLAVTSLSITSSSQANILNLFG